MKASVAALLAISLLGFGPVPSTDLLKRAVDPNPELQSYVASASLAAVLHAPVPVHKTFVGTAYYQKPKQKIVFDNATGPLSAFKELTESTPSFAEASAEYAITPLADDGKASTYRLVPSQPGRRVKSLTLTVDNGTGLITRAVWVYTNDGRLTFDQTYGSVGTFRLPSQENISARFPGYSVDGVLRLSNYRPNAPVPPAIFAEKN